MQYSSLLRSNRMQIEYNIAESSWMSSCAFCHSRIQEKIFVLVKTTPRILPQVDRMSRIYIDIGRPTNEESLVPQKKTTVEIRHAIASLNVNSSRNSRNTHKHTQITPVCFNFSNFQIQKIVYTCSEPKRHLPESLSRV